MGNLNDLISGLSSGLSAGCGRSRETAWYFCYCWILLGIRHPRRQRAGPGCADGVCRRRFGRRHQQVLLDNFAVLGGSRATLCLVLALLIVSRQKGSRQLAYSAAPLAPSTSTRFWCSALPVVLNPVLAVPFILTPIVSMLVSYAAVISGWMPAVQATVTGRPRIFQRLSGHRLPGREARCNW